MNRAKKRLHLLVTAGPTREPLDAVRFISNYSTGVLGYAIAQEAKRRGHQVILVSGPTCLARPKGVLRINIQTVQQMQEELEKRFPWCNALIMSAAVGDFRAQKRLNKKIKRGRRKELILRLTQNPDILASLGQRKGAKFLVGFALETERLKARAWAKLEQKNLDLLVATQMRVNTYPFGPTPISALIINRQKQIQKLKRVTKAGLARILLDSIEKTML